MQFDLSLGHGGFSNLAGGKSLCFGGKILTVTPSRVRLSGECKNFPVNRMSLSADNWVDRLGSESGQESALLELRELLVSRMTTAFRHERKVDSAFIDDTVQDASLKILGSLSQFRGDSKFTTWATTIAIRTAYTELRRKRWQDVSLDNLVEAQGDFVAVSSQEVGLDDAKNQIVNAMYAVINEKLTLRQRTVLLAELHGMSMARIGEELKSNRNAIYKLAHDARKKLRQELEAIGFTASDFLSLQKASS